MPKQYSKPPEMQIETNRTYKVLIKTNKGDITLELNPAEAPITVNNFVTLARDDFYNNVTFHRVVDGFVIQGGDPEGSGRGGPGYKFQDEPVKRRYRAGTVAMANAGPNTNGSQFFICLEDQPGLPPSYTIFGDTISGMDVVRKVRVGDVMQSVTVE
ncbi:MAG TPA: peptidylprolyl isomerase [Ktedonobacteraceae bacterium]|jgi:cyclophilin family peptidyl-prolyl cis-trans isomerase